MSFLVDIPRIFLFNNAKQKRCFHIPNICFEAKHYQQQDQDSKCNIMDYWQIVLLKKTGIGSIHIPPSEGRRSLLILKVFAFDTIPSLRYLVTFDFLSDLLLIHACKFLSNWFSPFHTLFEVRMVPSFLKCFWLKQLHDLMQFHLILV